MLAFEVDGEYVDPEDSEGSAVIRSAPGIRHDCKSRRDLVNDETHFALAKCGDDGVLRDAEPGERSHQHRGLERGRELPGDGVTRFDPAAEQTCGNSLRVFGELGRTQPAAIVVCEHDVVRSATGCLVDKSPEARLGRTRPVRTHFRRGKEGASHPL